MTVSNLSVRRVFVSFDGFQGMKDMSSGETHSSEKHGSETMPHIPCWTVETPSCGSKRIQGSSESSEAPKGKWCFFLIDLTFSYCALALMKDYRAVEARSCLGQLLPLIRLRTNYLANRGTLLLNASFVVYRKVSRPQAAACASDSVGGDKAFSFQRKNEEGKAADRL